MILTKYIPRLRILVVVLIWAGFASSSQGQQLAITSPASGAVYAAGQTVNVTVSVTNGAVLAVQVGAQDIGFSAYQTTSPYSFSLSVPTKTIGLKNLFAVGLVANETVIVSPVISIDVEPGAVPTAISFQQSMVTFGYVGQQRRIGVTASFADGSTLDISQSSQITFSSDTPSVVSVDPTGLMTANGPGIAHIAVTDGTLTATMQAIGPTAIKGDLNGDGVVNSDDLFLLESMLGSTLTGPNDARDINGDGKIDILDVQALLTLCGASCPTLSSTTTALSASTNQVQLAKPVMLNAKVTGIGSDVPTGSVSYVVDGKLLDMGALNASNQASIVVTSLAVGTHTIVATYTGDSANSPSTSQSVSTQVVAIPGDVNSDGVVNCADIAIVRGSFGLKTGQPGFDPRADVNHDGIVNILDLAIVSKQFPAGTVCQ